MSDGELETMEQTGIRWNNCGDTVTPDHPDVAKEMTGSHCHECNDGHFERVVVELVRIAEIRGLLDFEELIDQLALAHRDLNRLQSEGIDDTGGVQDRIKANRELQRAVETLREAVTAGDSGLLSENEEV